MEVLCPFGISEPQSEAQVHYLLLDTRTAMQVLDLVSFPAVSFMAPEPHSETLAHHWHYARPPHRFGGGVRNGVSGPPSKKNHPF